ncbi:MAG: hypothetical protein ACE5K2_03475 [Candidatus Zixiibacteriota bacterium]
MSSVVFGQVGPDGTVPEPPPDPPPPPPPPPPDFFEVGVQIFYYGWEDSKKFTVPPRQDLNFYGGFEAWGHYRDPDAYPGDPDPLNHPLYAQWTRTSDGHILYYTVTHEQEMEIYQYPYGYKRKVTGRRVLAYDTEYEIKIWCPTPDWSQIPHKEWNFFAPTMEPCWFKVGNGLGQ